MFDLLADARARRLRAQADELALVAAACAAHRVDEGAASIGLERLVVGGASGTPTVGEFLAHELAMVLHVSPSTAAFRVADALNLKFRHPRLWEAVQRLELESWQAVRVASGCASAGLDAAAAGWVDAQLAAAAARLPWPRVLRLLAGLIVKAAPAAAAERAEKARTEHKVSLGEVADGSTTIFARLPARDGLFLDGMVERIAQILGERGDGGTRQQRRARALGILATPD